MVAYMYGMRLRGFSPGCQPKEGLLFRKDGHWKQYYDLLAYNRKLTDEELNQYDLDFLQEIHS